MPVPATSLSHTCAAPKYSLRGRSADAVRVVTPGPGAYAGDHVREAVKYSAAPKFGFGASRREGLYPTLGPGPGHYTPFDDRKEAVQRAGFGGAGRILAHSAKAESPGPGQYSTTPRVGQEGPKLSMGAKQEYALTTPSPGPAAYNPPDSSDLNMKRMPQHSFSRSTRGKAKNGNAPPGPGQYNPSLAVRRSRSAEFSFGTASRKDTAPKLEPGPGSYNTERPVVDTSPKFSTGSRSAREMRTLHLTPGPGTYAQDSTTHSKFDAAPKFGFGSSARSRNGDAMSPGPGQYSGAYEQVRPCSPRVGFGTATRAPSGLPGSPRRAESGPGPGAYTTSPRIGKEGPKYSASGRSDLSKLVETPGPGTYQLESGAHGGNGRLSAVAPKFGFGTSQRQYAKPVGVPGPGSYQDGRPGERSSPQHTFGQKCKVPSVTYTPGPGAHEHTSLFIS